MCLGTQSAARLDAYSFDHAWATTAPLDMDMDARPGTITDVRLDYALLARHACRWWTQISHEHECILE